MLDVYEKLLQIARDNKLEVEETDMIGGENSGLRGLIVIFRGQEKVNGVIAIASRLTLKQKVDTLAHELGHYFLNHRGDLTTEVDKVKELEADQYGFNLINQIKRNITMSEGVVPKC